MIGTSTYSKRQGSYTCLLRPDSVGQEFIQRESEDGFFGAGFMRRPTVKLRRDPVEGRLSVAGLEAVLGGKSLPKPRGIPFRWSSPASLWDLFRRQPSLHLWALMLLAPCSLSGTRLREIGQAMNTLQSWSSFLFYKLLPEKTQVFNVTSPISVC